ncbi:MAG: tRNA uridine-5-carboxymethylaminomethyl(34) synthesis enzyme MnmG [Bacteroidetes bacterium]|nr:tRNA uridine-5-carboxymethylaminomethyl(34) synthesis enzyme MnmG [Bacteroidota bacterium]
MKKKYDIIIVGAGHAGCEAAYASSMLGSNVLLITSNMETIAKMSCNPAMGGVAKGQLIREIDAIGGMSGIITDSASIQFRMLNLSKGPAMWSPRSQCDRMKFSWNWRLALEKCTNLDFWQDNVIGFSIVDNSFYVKTTLGLSFEGKSLILTTGTFLNGIIHIGNVKIGGGRASESSSKGITECLSSFGFIYGRMKTGTPPRVDGRTINYSILEEQKGDDGYSGFSFWSKNKPLINKSSCFITYTNEDVHSIIESGFKESPLFNGSIRGIGPRYCPSIEDKVNRFADKNRHQIFIEPEGEDTIEVYINGFSSSLPENIQYKALKKIKGFENVKMFRPGYAIEYDYFDPTQLFASLETKLIPNLYFAGQINGTTGYEEAACQGLIAGINAHNKINNKNPLILSRQDAYIGVLIDDLVNKGTNEPYRMFTSRAEFRILLRQDNADQRLCKIGRDIGLLSQEKYEIYKNKLKRIEELIWFVNKEKPDLATLNDFLQKLNSNKLTEKTTIYRILSRPEVSFNSFINNFEGYKDYFKNFEKDEIEEAEIMIKYSKYIEKERELAEKIISLDYIPIKEGTDFSKINSLSSESREKLNKIKPATIGQASRISGVSPADVSVLLVHFGR